MLGTGLHFSKSRNGEDRFYSAANARRNRNNHQKQSQDPLRRVQSDADVIITQKSPEDSDCPDGRVGVQVQQQRKDLSPVARPLARAPLLSNFEQFLESVTPSVPTQYLSKVKFATLLYHSFLVYFFIFSISAG